MHSSFAHTRLSAETRVLVRDFFEPLIDCCFKAGHLINPFSQILLMNFHLPAGVASAAWGFDLLYVIL
jgi:hypothetical protein